MASPTSPGTPVAMPPASLTRSEIEAKFKEPFSEQLLGAIQSGDVRALADWIDDELGEGAEIKPEQFIDWMEEIAVEHRGSDRIRIYAMALSVLSQLGSSRDTIDQLLVQEVDLEGNYTELEPLIPPCRAALIESFTRQGIRVSPATTDALFTAEFLMESSKESIAYFRIMEVDELSVTLSTLSIGTLYILLATHPPFFGSLQEATKARVIDFCLTNYAWYSSPNDLLQVMVASSPALADALLGSFEELVQDLRFSSVHHYYHHASAAAKVQFLVLIDDKEWYGQLPLEVVKEIVGSEPGGIAFFTVNQASLGPWVRKAFIDWLHQSGSAEMNAAVQRWLVEEAPNMEPPRMAQFLLHPGMDVDAVAEVVSLERLFHICDSEGTLFQRLPPVRRAALLTHIEEQGAQGSIRNIFLVAIIESDCTGFAWANSNFSHFSSELQRAVVDSAVGRLDRLAGEHEFCREVARLLRSLSAISRDQFERLWESIVAAEGAAVVRSQFPDSSELGSWVHTYTVEVRELLLAVHSLRIEVDRLVIEAEGAGEALQLAQRGVIRLRDRLFELMKERREFDQVLGVMLGDDEQAGYRELATLFGEWTVTMRKQIESRFFAVYGEEEPHKYQFIKDATLRQLLGEIKDRQQVRQLKELCLSLIELDVSSEERQERIKGAGRSLEESRALLEASEECLIGWNRELDSWLGSTELTMLLRELSSRTANGIDSGRSPALLGVAQVIEGKRAGLRALDPVEGLDLAEFLGEAGNGGLCNIRLYGGGERVTLYLGCSYSNMTERGFGFTATAGTLRCLEIEIPLFIELQKLKGALADFQLGSERRKELLLAQIKRTEALATGPLNTTLNQMLVEEWSHERLEAAMETLRQADPLYRYLTQPGIVEFWEGLSEKVDSLDQLVSFAAGLDEPIYLTAKELFELSSPEMQEVKARLVASLGGEGA